MKRIMILLLLFFCIIISAPAYAMDTPSLQGEELFNTTTEEIVGGTFSLNPIELLNKGLQMLFKEVRESGDVIITIIVIAAMSGIVHIMESSFSSKGVGEAAFFGCFTLMSAAAVKCFSLALGYGMEVIGHMTDFITKISPLLSILLLAGGNVTSASAFHPVLSMAVYVITIICQKCIMPLVCFGAVLAVVGNISDKLQISNFCSLIRSVSKWILAAALTIFTGISGIYGLSAPALDAVGSKAAKFAVGSLVPVVGGFLSDSLETVVSGAKLMKNAAGTSGLVVMCVICITPVLKIGAMLLLLRLAAAAIEPLTDKRISGMLWEMAGSVTTVFAMVITVAVLFIISISIILAATS